MKITDNKIKDINEYTEAMKKSLYEKAFFLGKINADSFLDYGCADGTLLKFIQSMYFSYPNYKYIGYDICQEMLEKAKKDNQDIIFTDNLDSFIKEKTENSVLVLSSIIHEIYSYSNPSNFWEEVFEKINTKYIVIRDMMIVSSQEKLSNPELVRRVKMAENDNLVDFEKNWGSITSNKNLLHYLLKYRYINNWEREVKENYLPITVQELIAKIPDNYKITYLNLYLPKFIKNTIEEDFGIDLKEDTHVEMIIERID